MRILRAGPGVRLIRGLRIPMRDGVHLAADLYVADVEGALASDPAAALPATPMPIVMDYIPYRKDDVDPTAMRHYLELPRHGYPVLRVDIRGTGASEGHAIDEYVEQEQLDGCDAIEWLAGQPWCDGHVNMMGISYGGFTALQVAALRPPHLTSIIAVDFTDDRYTDDCHYRGGLLRQYYDLAWYGTRMIAWNAMPPDMGGADNMATWRDRLARDEPYLLSWLRHQVDGPYWRQGSVAGDAGRIVCPAFLIGGWRDGYPNPPLRLYPALGGPRRLLIGPWDHRYPDAAIPGPRIDHLREVVRWLDHWCKGTDNGVMAEPPIVVYVQEAGSLDADRLDTPGHWRAESDWPPAGATERAFSLRAGELALAPGDGPDEGGLEADRLGYDPTVGTTGGLWSGGVPFGLPGDQRPDEDRSLVYTSGPLETPLSIIGRGRARLFVGSSAAILGVAASLSDVAPDGTSSLVAKGMVNVTRRHSLSDPQPLEPGEVVELAVEIDATAWRFRAGHRIRLSVAAADWPNVWPTPEPGFLEIWRDRSRPSQLVLPVVPDESPWPAPTFAPSPLAVRSFSALKPAATWSIHRDGPAGRATVTIGHDTEHTTPDGARIERRSGGEFSVDPGDPAHVVACGWHHARRTRPAASPPAHSSTETRADVTIVSDASSFHVAIDLATFIDGAPAAQRRWAETIPRHLL